MKEKFALILSTIQTLMLVAIVVILLTDKKWLNDPKRKREQTELQTKLTKPIKIADTDAIWGKKDAPNTIFVWVDYQCPYCMDVYKNLKDIEKEYISTGKAKVIFRDFPLKMHRFARPLATAVECARRQGKFWEMADLILTSSEKPDSTSIERWMVELKLDVDAFTICQSDSTIENLFKTDIDEAKSYGVRGTPALFINNTYYRGSLSVSNLKDILDGNEPALTNRNGSCNQR